MSQDQFFESLEMSNKSLKTALACLAPEEGGSEGARYKTLLLITNILKPYTARYCAVARGMVNQIEDILHLSKVVKNKNLQ